MILTPENDPYFYQTLRGNLPPGFTPLLNARWNPTTQQMETITAQELQEYIHGGQYEEELEEVELNE